MLKIINWKHVTHVESNWNVVSIYYVSGLVSKVLLKTETETKAFVTECFDKMEAGDIRRHVI